MVFLGIKCGKIFPPTLGMACARDEEYEAAQCRRPSHAAHDCVLGRFERNWLHALEAGCVLQIYNGVNEEKIGSVLI